MERINNSYKILFFLTLFFFCGNSFSQPIFITKLTDLDFGDVFIGTPGDVQHTDPGAAKFSFYHPKGGNQARELFVSFTLPANLVFGVNNLPITFDQNHTAWHNADQVGGRTNFDPHATENIGMVLKNEVIYVWLGGNVPSTTGYPSGLYTGTVVMTIAF